MPNVPARSVVWARMQKVGPGRKGDEKRREKEKKKKHVKLP